MPPLAAGAHDIEQAVQQAAHVRGPPPTTGLGSWDQRFEQPILTIAECLAGPVIPNQSPIFGCPHVGLQVGELPTTPSTQPPNLVKPTYAPFQNGFSV